MRTSLGLLSFLLVTAACTTDNAGTADTAQGAAGSTAVADNDAARATVDSLRNAWKAAADRKDSVAIAAMYTDDAVMVGGQGPAATSRAEIQSSVAELFTVGTIESIDSKEVIASGDLAYDYGTYRLRMTPPNAQPSVQNGYYVVVLRRQGDGTWKIVRHLDVVPPARQPR